MNADALRFAATEGRAHFHMKRKDQNEVSAFIGVHLRFRPDESHALK